MIIVEIYFVNAVVVVIFIVVVLVIVVVVVVIVIFVVVIVVVTVVGLVFVHFPYSVQVTFVGFPPFSEISGLLASHV